MNHIPPQIEADSGSSGELPVINPAEKIAGGLMVQLQHAPLFPIELVEKDFRYAIETAQVVNASTPAATAVHAVYQAAIAHAQTYLKLVKIN